MVAILDRWRPPLSSTRPFSHIRVHSHSQTHTHTLSHRYTFLPNNITEMCVCVPMSIHLSMQIHAYADTYIYLNITYYVVKVHYFSNFVLLIVRAFYVARDVNAMNLPLLLLLMTPLLPLHTETNFKYNRIACEKNVRKPFQPVFSFAQNL